MAHSSQSHPNIKLSAWYIVVFSKSMWNKLKEEERFLTRNQKNVSMFNPAQQTVNWMAGRSHSSFDLYAFFFFFQIQFIFRYHHDIAIIGLVRWSLSCQISGTDGVLNMAHGRPG